MSCDPPHQFEDRDPSLPRILMPTLHAAQMEAWTQMERFTVLRCGRRWGKTEFLGTLATSCAMRGGLVGWFAPDYKRLSPSYTWCQSVLSPVEQGSNKSTGLINTLGGGQIEFWTLGDTNAGRSRRYNLALIDEAAFAGPEMVEIFRAAIKPTLLDFRGAVVVASNTNGIDEEQFFWQICNQKRHRFGPRLSTDGTYGYHAPSSTNPFLPAEDLEDLRKTEHPLVFKQEYLAEFVDWSSDAFFSLDSLLDEAGLPTPWPSRVDAVFAVIDSATKTGTDNDGTAVTYFGLNRLGDVRPPLHILDWDISKIEGALLETWLPTVFERGVELANSCNSRGGFGGVLIEDKASGMVLLQQARRRAWPAYPIDSKLTSVGKDERAISVSGYVYRRMVRLTQPAHDKTTMYNGVKRNHLVSQVTGFRVGDKDAARRADDLLDTFCYGVAVGLGDSRGF